MTIAVTGATGHLGRLVIDALLERGVPADRIVAAVRSPEKAADLAARGVRVRRADYTDPRSLTDAFAGVQRLLLISSSSEIGQRATQHGHAIDAAKAAGVELIGYTSGPRAQTSPMQLLADHRDTELLVEASGLPYVVLRNNWYFENYTAQLATAFQYGAMFGSAGDGRIAGAARADFAEAAAVVLTTPGHENTTYELGGDQPFTRAEFAAEVSRQSGREVVYTDLPADGYTKVLLGAGLPEPLAHVLADVDVAISQGHLDVGTGGLRELTGRPTTPLADAVATALKD